MRGHEVAARLLQRARPDGNGAGRALTTYGVFSRFTRRH
jgi:hypothetical protein